MKKVAPIDRRKDDHIKISLGQDVRSGLSSGLECYRFIHEALPEVNLAAVDTTLKVFGKKLNAPILISSMTGGTELARRINQCLAEAAHIAGVAMSVGSQRAALENPNLIKTFSIARKFAPDILLFANLGAIQLNYGLNLDDCHRAVDMIQADALCLHLNPVQEAVQTGGNTNFFGLANKIEMICKSINVPVIVKEVGWGISERTAKILAGCGVAAIDVAGAGGTSWSQVEMYRAPNEFSRQLASTFIHWGIPTSKSILNVKKFAPEIMIFASGGLINGLDISKCIALGATLGGMAGQILKTAVQGVERTVEILYLTQQQIQITMFASGATKISNLGIEKIEVV
jgi:isopentenyl-diphosphate delta-isomerase